MRMAHELPGTTFSNTQDRGNYNSEVRAVLTLRELEKWLTLAIGIYHETVHRGLWESPAACWKRSTGTAKLVTVKSEKAFLIDFLPVIQRSIGRTGFLVDHISYYADTLKPWIANRHSLDRFVIRRDPRDISKVWVLDPESKHYLEIPYRSLANPAVTLWEHKKAVAKLREKGRAQLNEAAIFRMIDSMREITETAAKERKRARLDKARRVHLEASPKKTKLTAPDCAEPATQQAKPFEDIELW
jgi:putative transposase